MTWNDAWALLNKDGNLAERPNQRQLAEAIFRTTTDGGILLAEAPVGVGKSFAYAVPLIYRVRAGQRCVISTETTNLQDQLVDRDLPRLVGVFGDFVFRSLKGRSWYLCIPKASEQHALVRQLHRSSLGDGEKRDVERLLGRRVSAEEWEEVSGDPDFCAQNKCTADRGCYSSRARELAARASVVVTNHAILRTHAELDDGLLGDFDHLVVDEAHTLERTLIDGWSDEVSPYELYQAFKSIWDGIGACNLSGTSTVPEIQEAEKLSKEAISSAVNFFRQLYERREGHVADDNEWRREQFTLSEQTLSGLVSDKLRLAMEDYELMGPGRMIQAARFMEKLAKSLDDEIKTMARGTRKVSKARTAARKLHRTFDMVGEAMGTRDGIVMRYGVPYAVLGEGHKAFRGEHNVRVRCVPLDVSRRAHETVWKGLKSVVLVSGTLRDETDGTFRYVQTSLGLQDAQTLVVGSNFDFARNQLVYVTPGTYEPVDVPGAQYSIDEMVEVLNASKGRALVLFTANAELAHAADALRRLRQLGRFDHEVLIQEAGASKHDLIEAFVKDKSSVLLGSKSFFTGVDFPGETCSIVVLAKFPLPQYNALCKAQIAWWRGRGYREWYEREALQIFKQANGRLIRNETDRGVIAILDRRVADARERVCDLTRMELTATGSSLTNDIAEMEKWLNAEV